MKELTPQETETLVKLLNKCQPLGNLPDPVFVALARVVVYPAIELVLLKETAGHIEVFLTKRARNDLTWSDEYCLQGTVLRPTDANIAEAMKRLLITELGGIQAEPVYTGVYSSHSTRGAGIGFNYFLEINEPPVRGRFFDVDSLPDMDQAHVIMIKRAATAFKSSKSEAHTPSL